MNMQFFSCIIEAPPATLLKKMQGSINRLLRLAPLLRFHLHDLSQRCYGCLRLLADLFPVVKLLDDSSAIVESIVDLEHVAKLPSLAADFIYIHMRICIYYTAYYTSSDLGSTGEKGTN